MFRTMYDLAKVVGPCQTNYYVLIRQIRKVTVRSVFRALDQGFTMIACLLLLGEGRGVLLLYPLLVVATCLYWLGS